MIDLTGCNGVRVKCDDAPKNLDDITREFHAIGYLWTKGKWAKTKGEHKLGASYTVTDWGRK